MAICKSNCECKKDEKIPQEVKDDFAYVCMSRTLNRLILIVIVCICLLFASNAAWMIYESQFETISCEQDVDDINNVNIGEQGDLINGAESENPG